MKLTVKLCSLRHLEFLGWYCHYLGTGSFRKWKFSLIACGVVWWLWTVNYELQKIVQWISTLRFAIVFLEFNLINSISYFVCVTQSNQFNAHTLLPVWNSSGTELLETSKVVLMLTRNQTAGFGLHSLQMMSQQIIFIIITIIKTIYIKIVDIGNKSLSTKALAYWPRWKKIQRLYIVIFIFLK